MNDLTKEEIYILQHSLGLDWERKPYRNYYCAGPDSSIHVKEE